MKTLEEIKEVINNYDKLIVLAKAKIKIMKEIDSNYNTAKGIEEISFDDEIVYVQCDNSCRGCYDSMDFSFPLNYLSLNDDELKKSVEQEKTNRLAEEAAEKERKKLKEEQDKEKREFEQYQKLKEKFEFKIK